MNEVQIIGTGSYAPLNIMTNHQLSEIVDTSDEWIFSRTGIKERHISQGENTSDLATKAALSALQDAKVDVEDIDLIIVASHIARSICSSHRMYSSRKYWSNQCNGI